MLYNNTELRILEQVYIKPGTNMRGLSKSLKLGMPSIQCGLRKVKNLVKKEKSGNQIKFYIDYSEEDIIPALYFVESSRLKKLPSKVRITVMDFLKELKEKPLISVVFGSYAKEDYNKDSDVDILLVFQDLKDRKNLERIARNASMKTNVKLSPVYLNYEVFKESFHNSSKKFFSDLKKDKILLNGIEWWRLLENEES